MYDNQANYYAHEFLQTHLVPKDMVKSDDAEYRNLGNIQITHLLSAEHAPYDAEAEEIMKSCSSNGETPYWIPSGASTHPLGGCGYARFAFEIAQQEQDMNVYFDTIIAPCASGSTLGGMIAGFKLLENTTASSVIGNRKQRKLIGIDAFADEPGKTEAQVLQIAKATAAKIGLSESHIREEDVEVDLRWNAGSYGLVDDQTQAAIKLMASQEGILTDPVYTGKTLNGLIQKARLGEFTGCENVLFVHTGGVPALSAYPNVR
jgi:1-aminocyclopropane-1-carboxylate deaminase